MSCAAAGHCRVWHRGSLVGQTSTGLLRPLSGGRLVASAFRPSHIIMDLGCEHFGQLTFLTYVPCPACGQSRMASKHDVKCMKRCALPIMPMPTVRTAADDCGRLVDLLGQGSGLIEPMLVCKGAP